ncbi:MAG: ABC transporter permease subunit [Candidatus Hadarchaeia archaeon]
MNSFPGLSIARETARDKWKITALLTFIFMGFSAMYIGIYPSFEDALDQLTAMPFEFIRGFGAMDTFVGYINMELYQIFWVLILSTLLAYISASIISEEVESGTIDILLANPISRKRVVLEKFLGMFPLVFTVNFATMGTVYVMTLAIEENIVFSHLLLTHLWSIPYFLAVVSISLVVSVILDKKMRASIVSMAFIVAMYIFESIVQLVPDYEGVGSISLIHYFDPSDSLVGGKISVLDPLVLIAVILASVFFAVLYFERKDIL